MRHVGFLSFNSPFLTVSLITSEGAVAFPENFLQKHPRWPPLNCSLIPSQFLITVCQSVYYLLVLRDRKDRNVPVLT